MPTGGSRRMLGLLTRLACFCGIRQSFRPLPLYSGPPAQRLLRRGLAGKRWPPRASLSQDEIGGGVGMPPEEGGSAAATPYWLEAGAGAGGSRKPNKIKPGTVYFVATPMGNLGDISLRALDVLSGVDLIASEDTRHTGLLLQGLGLGKKRQVSHHQHNLAGRVPELVSKARAGMSIAVVTDAGTPGVSDPGSDLAAACWENGVPVVPVPGSCAAVAALSVSGFISTEFVFYGFLPRSGQARAKKLHEIVTQEKVAIFYESPQRIARTLQDLLQADQTVSQGERVVMCARELTKLHEDLYRAPLREAAAHYGGDDDAAPRGEFTVVLGPLVRPQLSAEDLEGQVRAMLRECMEEGGMSTSEAVKRVAKAMEGVSKSAVYDIALSMRGSGSSKEGAEGGEEEGGKRKKKRKRPPSEEEPPS